MTEVLVTMVLVVLAGLVGAGTAGYRLHRQAVQAPDSFPCRMRWSLCGPPVGRWRPSSRRGVAYWVHDVLVVQQGLLRARTDVVPVRFPEGVVRPAGRRVPGFGRRAQTLTFRSDDDVLIELAVRRADRTRLAGPYLAAAIPDRDGASTEPGRGR